MEYEKIISVTGLPGLYELVSSKSDGAIVRSLDDKSTRFVSSRIHNFSHLESIEVYTSRENVNLVEVFNAMDSAKEKLPDDKDNNAIKKYFENVYPELDFERVYTSDMKKMVKWFSVLKSNDIELKLREQPVEEEEEPQPEAAPKAKEKKAKEEAAEKPVKESKEKEPAKKAAPAKAAKKEEPAAAPKKKAAAKAEKPEKKKETPAKKKAATKKSAKKK